MAWIYNYIYMHLCIQCISPLMLWVWIPIRAKCTTLCGKVCQGLLHNAYKMTFYFSNFFLSIALYRYYICSRITINLNRFTTDSVSTCHFCHAKQITVHWASVILIVVEQKMSNFFSYMYTMTGTSYIQWNAVCFELEQQA